MELIAERLFVDIRSNLQLAHLNRYADYSLVGAIRGRCR